MKNFSRLLLLLMLPALVLVSCKGSSKTQKEPEEQVISDPLPDSVDDSDLPEELRKKYKQDAARLTLRDLEAHLIGQVTAADLPPEWITYYYDKLVKIYRLCRDDSSIPGLAHIHTLPSPHLRKVMVTLEEDCPWAERWDQKIISSENLTLNQLTSRYLMSIETVRNGVAGNYYTLKSPFPLNTKEFCRLLGKVGGIETAEPEGVAGDGNNIQTARSTREDLKKILYSVGWGDCPSGCIQRSYWSFEVQKDGSVLYLGQSGDQPPADLLKGE